MGDYTTVLVAQADSCAVSDAIHGSYPFRLSEPQFLMLYMVLTPFVSVNCLVSLWLIVCTPFVQSATLGQEHSQDTQTQGWFGLQRRMALSDAVQRRAINIAFLTTARRLIIPANA